MPRLFDENSELTTSLCVKQLQSIIIDSSVTCTQCPAKLHKTSSCNELQHCHGSRLCWFCGYRGDIISKHGIIDHFGGVDGIRQCPRFLEGISRLNKLLKYECNQNCHNHNQECQKKTHNIGKQQMEMHMKSMRLYKAISSIHEPLRTKVIAYASILFRDAFDFQRIA